MPLFKDIPAELIAVAIAFTGLLCASLWVAC